MRKSNYDKWPGTHVPGGKLWQGWEAILAHLKSLEKLQNGAVLVVECYQGVHMDELKAHLQSLGAALFVDTATCFKSAHEIEALTFPYVTDDRLFGYRCHFSYIDFLNWPKVEETRCQLEATPGLKIVFGHAAAVVAPQCEVLVYADMPRWEIQMRSRRKEIAGLGVENHTIPASEHYKRGYFVDWVVCDKLKTRIMAKADFWLDTVTPHEPKMIDAATFEKGMDLTVRRPFRVVPFFDPAPWGGQWMKTVCGLDPEKENYGWCFDCVPEENSLILYVGGVSFEMPSVNLVLSRTRQLLGPAVEARFGADFPIRFDFLDTIGGGNLSLQVHPTTQYIRDTFGIYYTQDESYYMLDAKAGATVFLGLKTGVDASAMIAALKHSQKTGEPFDAGKYVNQWAARKHDHFLIPAGTVHCSGAGAMVLEISATPSIFTFKLWDWGRLGLDGLPRPINIGHGANVIQWERQTDLISRHFVNAVEPIAEGDGWREERTGLHENEFIETRRHWFTKPVHHTTGGGVNVLNLVEGEEAVVESPDGAFEPFTVHYAETFIVPACVGPYTIKPSGKGEKNECGTIKAYVRFKD